MIHAQNAKFTNLIRPGNISTVSTSSGTVDCLTYRYAELWLHLATQTAANTDTLIRVSEGDTTSSFATHADLALTTVAPDTSSPQLYKWFLDLRKRKRYLKLEYTPGGAARAASAGVNTYRSEAIPDSASERGVTAQVVA